MVQNAFAINISVAMILMKSRFVSFDETNVYLDRKLFFDQKK